MHNNFEVIQAYDMYVEVYLYICRVQGLGPGWGQSDY